MGKHILIWLIIVIFTPLVLPALLSPKAVSSFIRADYHSAIAILGGKSELNRDLVALYQSNLQVVSRFANEFRDSHDDSDKFRDSGDPIGEAIADIPGEWAESVKLQAYSMTLRLVVLVKWSVWLALPMLMGIVAGMLERKLKNETFSPPLPPVYNTSAHALIALSFLILLWIICPIPLPVAIIPTAAVLMTAFLSLAITHYPNY
jgi:hypothetical protein